MFPIFLWVKKYKSLENFHITLDDAYDIEFEMEKDKITTLNIKRKEVPSDKERFYGPNIDSIKAIVGKNGTGKTSLLELLGYFSAGNILELRDKKVEEFLIVYKTGKTDEKGKIIFVVEGHSNKSLEKYSVFLDKDKHKEFHNNYYSFEMTEDNKFLKNTSELSKSGVMRLKMASLMKESNVRATMHNENVNHNPYMYKLNLNVNDVAKKTIYDYVLLKTKSTKNYLNFYFVLKIFKRNFYFNEITKKLKETFEREVSQNYEIKTNDKEYFTKRSKRDNEFYKKYNKIEKKLIFNVFCKSDKSIRNIILNEFCNHLYCYKIYEEIKNKMTLENMENEIVAQYNKLLGVLKKDQIKIVEELLKSIETYENIEKLKINVFRLIESLESLEKSGLLIKESDLFYKITSIRPEKEEKRIRLENFLKLYDELITYSWNTEMSTDEMLDILSLTEQGMSDGEKIRLNQFATICGALNGEFRDKDYITILFDEAETSLHPEWCRTLINDYLEELRINYPDKKFKLIFATHSPFILSDLLAEDIISLDIKDGKTNIDSTSLKKSFGGNIHNLLKQNMFMESTFGEFARLKIKKFVKDIEEAKSYEDLKNLSQSLLLKEVGEPLVKRRLETMIEDKMKSVGNSKEYYEMKIQEYKDKLAKIEKK